MPYLLEGYSSLCQKALLYLVESYMLWKVNNPYPFMVIFLHLQEKVPTLIAIDSAACSADPDQISRRLNQLVCMYTFCLSLINSCLAGQELNVDIYNEVLGFCPWVDESLCSKSPVFASRQQASFASHLINVNYNKTNTFSIYCLVSL